ncbi:MAG: hypothetical protein KGI50_00195 [Patescibacteria group bacterium]|nr:hypothetical protein [Patescibacteria group bacterium]MDE2438218.1 hypothetical protein [Patescibacteria group bacterium]
MKKQELKVVYEQVKDVSEEETRRRLDRVFDILFNAVLEQDQKKNLHRSQSRKNHKK